MEIISHYRSATLISLARYRAKRPSGSRVSVVIFHRYAVDDTHLVLRLKASYRRQRVATKGR